MTIGKISHTHTKDKDKYRKSKTTNDREKKVCGLQQIIQIFVLYLLVINIDHNTEAEY